MSRRKDSDEAYVLDLCDSILGTRSLRQFSFPFLVGDAGTKLLVDAYYPRLKIVVEYREMQHSEEVKLFDRKWTRSGMTRDKQRARYDQLRRDVLPAHGITPIEIDYSELPHRKAGRKLLRTDGDRAILEARLHPHIASLHLNPNGRRTPDVDSYVATLNEQLSSYRENILGVREKGTFTHLGKQLSYGHILPTGHKWMNILEPFQPEVRAYIEASGVELHRYFHHLNSSQAFALNLFYPFFKRRQSAVLLKALGLHGTAKQWGFEHIPDTLEGTNVDVYWRTKENTGQIVTTWCEVKLTERKFGTAKADEDHLTKLRKIYRPRFEETGCARELLDAGVFFEHYQLLRNIWLAAEAPTSRVLLLLPWENPALWTQIAAVRRLLSPVLNERVLIASIEEVLIALSHAGSPDWIPRYIRQLQEKYLVRNQ